MYIIHCKQRTVPLTNDSSLCTGSVDVPLEQHTSVNTTLYDTGINTGVQLNRCDMMHTTQLHTEPHTLKAIRSYSYRRLINSLTDAECIYMSVCVHVCVCVSVCECVCGVPVRWWQLGRSEHGVECA